MGQEDVLRACKPGRVPPGHEIISGEFRLANGEAVQLYRRQSVAPPAAERVCELAKVQREIDAVTEECAALAAELHLESEAAERDQVKKMITDLHEYNEVKDIAQALIGQIASIEGSTTKHLYPRFNLSLTD